MPSLPGRLLRQRDWFKHMSKMPQRLLLFRPENVLIKNSKNRILLKPLLYKLLFSSAPKPCPPGTYSNSEYGAQSCTVCPDGSYANSSGSIQCTICPKGSYCADLTQLPVKCPRGTYANSPLGQGLCTACPSNTYANSTGTVDCTACPTSMCCNDPRVAPTSC